MRVRRFADAASFLSASESFLVAREALHNLPLAVARNCVADRTRYPGRNYFAVLDDDAGPVGAAVMTPPHRVQAYVAPDAVGALVADLVDGGWSPTGVHGPVAASDAFAAAWCRARGGSAAQRMNLRAFELSAVVAAPPTPGGARVARADDLRLVEAWYRAFAEEAHMAHGDVSPEELARRAVRDGRLMLWEDDGVAVAQAGVVGSTPRGARIGAVYTPPNRRRRGYATALVEEVSRRALAEGRTFCFLFTDLANPVSNSIYPKVGYRPVADLRDYDFVQPA